MVKQREEGFKIQFTDRIAEFATRALLYEVSVTPKPGLVDRANAGYHEDMDFYTFLNSAVSLTPYFCEMVETGILLSSAKPEETTQNAGNKPLPHDGSAFHRLTLPEADR